MDILQTGMYQIDRIEHFTENMRKMSHLEQRELQCSEIVLSELAKKIETEAVMLSKKEKSMFQSAHLNIIRKDIVTYVDSRLLFVLWENLEDFVQSGIEFTLFRDVRLLVL